MLRGIIKKLVPERGFGFISGERDDVFFHRSAVVEGRLEDLREGQRVEYLMQDEDTSAVHGAGPRATSVKPV